MGTYKLSQLWTCVDAAYDVHPALKIHNGRGMSFEYGLVKCKSAKHKLNAKSYTEAKVVRVSDYLPYNTWISLFMESYGYETTPNIIFQDNHIVMRIEKNEKKSCAGNYSHIDIHYFPMKYRVDSNSISIAYCSTEHMISYFFTKALHGMLLITLCEVSMRW